MSVQISFLANMGNFIRDVRKGRVELEDVSGALDDVRADAAGAGAKLERSFDEIAQSARQLKPQETIARPMVHASHEASEGVKSLRENTAQNLKEMAASTTGSVQDISSGVQGLLAELLEGFGPAGLIAGVATAAGLGMLTAQFEQNNAAADAERQTVGQLTQALIEAGDVGQRNLGAVADRLKQMASETDGSRVNLHDIAQLADQINVPFAELARHVADGGDATQYAIDKTQQLIDHNKSLLVETRTAARSGIADTGRENAATADRISKLESQRDKLKRVQDETRKAAAAEREWLEAGGDRLNRKAAATQAYADSIQSTLADAGTDWQSFADKEGGLSLAKYERLMSQKAAAIEQYQANVAIASGVLSDDALAYIESLGIDAAPLLAKFVRAPLDQQDRLAAIWATLGRESGTSFNNSLQDKVNGYQLDPIDVVVRPVLHKTKFQHMMDELTRPQYVDVVPRKIAAPLFGKPNP